METLAIQLDFRSKEPLSQQLQHQIQKLIEQNVLMPDTQLPAVRSMAEVLQVNFNTVARAYRALDEAGWLSTQRGRGTYILEKVDHIQPEEINFIEQINEKDLFQEAADFCQLATQSGMTNRQLHQLIDQQLLRARALNPPKKQYYKRISKKKHYATPSWDLEEFRSQEKHGLRPHNRKR